MEFSEFGFAPVMQLLPFGRKSRKLTTSFLVAHRARTDRSSRLALNFTSFARGATHFFNRLLNADQPAGRQCRLSGRDRAAGSA